MKRGLQIIAAVVALGVVITWASFGANRGWTKTEKPIKVLDEVTGIEGITQEKGFWPGVDFLGAGLFGAGPRWHFLFVPFSI
ncbi:MAG: hypothetical protein QM813_20940 [Verrucomicrobiota bacterium]